MVLGNNSLFRRRFQMYPSRASYQNSVEKQENTALVFSPHFPAHCHVSTWPSKKKKKAFKTFSCFLKLNTHLFSPWQAQQVSLGTAEEFSQAHPSRGGAKDACAQITSRAVEVCKDEFCVLLRGFPMPRLFSLLQPHWWTLVLDTAAQPC